MSGTFTSYSIDRIAHDLVWDYGIQGLAHPQAYKMRMTVAFGLERFWGEQHRFKLSEAHKATYWQKTWEALAEILQYAGIVLPDYTNDPNNLNTPNIPIDTDDPNLVRRMAERLWDDTNFPIEQRKVALAILTQLCDSMVWWTQRYKKFVPNGT